MCVTLVYNGNSLYLCHQNNIEQMALSQFIIQLFVNNEPKTSNIPLSEFNDIKGYFNVSLKVTDDGTGYCYSVDVKDITNSSVDDDTLLKMKDDGWYLSSDFKRLIKQL